MSKTIAIVGAGEGIGFSVAERFGKEGFQVALLARNAEKTQALVERLAGQSIAAKGFKADVLEREGLTAALHSVKEHFGPIDVLEYSPIPRGGFSPPRELGTEEQAYHLNLNVLGPIAAVQAVLPDMLERKSGTILFTSAASAQRPLIMTASFGIAAGALLNYVRILNRDVSADGVFAGFVAIAGIVVPPGLDDSPNAAYFPAECPRVKSEDIAELHWKLNAERNNGEAVIGDIDRLYSLPGFR
ncbi:SDR family oxidoreductase [Brenneria populi subsp. brevivirga]|uniref:SDR family NAD(P)-dependent oxidoreductase n=1 Tax=Brenneria populi TaxID=1505588 RepID=UPI002E175595|nr:SDR family oxidoreductase [Brenneria populi subsp. brevivirga]